MVEIASFLQDWILTIDAANKGIRILSIEFRLEHFAIVEICKQYTKALTYLFADSKIQGSLRCLKNRASVIDQYLSNVRISFKSFKKSRFFAPDLSYRMHNCDPIYNLP